MMYVLFFKQKTAYELRISDWSSDVCSSDLADFLLDALGRAFTDQEVMVAADVGDDRLVQLVTTDAHRARVHDAAQREHRHLGGAAADVDDHGAGRLGHRQAEIGRAHV